MKKGQPQFPCLGSHFTLPLSPPTLSFPVPRWTPESRLKQSQIIRRWKPWAQSTGPQTDLGKERSSRNAWKGGHRAAVTLWHHVLRQVTNAREALADRYQALSGRRMLRSHKVISSFCQEGHSMGMMGDQGWLKTGRRPCFRKVAPQKQQCGAPPSRSSASSGNSNQQLTSSSTARCARP